MIPNPILLTQWLAELWAKWGRNDEAGQSELQRAEDKMLALPFLAIKQNDTDVGYLKI